MSLLKKILNGVIFVFGGIATIAVGFFMLRGTMRMWDRKEKDPKDEKTEETKKK